MADRQEEWESNFEAAKQSTISHLAESKKEIAEAEEKVAAAKNEAAEAKKEVVKAEAKYKGTKDGTIEREMATIEWKMAVETLKNSQEALKSVQKLYDSAISNLVSLNEVIRNSRREYIDGRNHGETGALGPQQRQLVSIDQIQPLTEQIENLKLSLVREIRGNDRATPQMSAASLGSQHRAQLEKAGVFRPYSLPADAENGSSVLSPPELATLGECDTEHEIVCFVTRRLQQLFHPRKLVVVNSEEYKWLVTVANEPQFSEKPDLFLCHTVFYNEKPVFNSKDERLQRMRREGDRYGVLANWNLRDSIILTFEAKKKIDNNGFGEVINYGAHICNGKGPDQARLVLFDKTCFWLVESTRGYVSRVTTCEWDQPGSAEALSEFAILDGWTELLMMALDEFDVEAKKNAFLGAGAFGRVFRVKERITGREKALKIVLDKEKGAAKDWANEMHTIQEAKKICPNIVMGIDKSKWFDSCGGAALLSDVGERPHTLKNARKVIKESLLELHSKNVVHGDARIENVVAVNGAPCWIDFRQALLYRNKPGMRDELKMLEDSMERHGI